MFQVIKPKDLERKKVILTCIVIVILFFAIRKEIEI
nr:MAG TPA: hypothetical protein [Caudoviricetes sp.]